MKITAKPSIAIGAVHHKPRFLCLLIAAESSNKEAPINMSQAKSIPKCIHWVEDKISVRISFSWLFALVIVSPIPVFNAIWTESIIYTNTNAITAKRKASWLLKLCLSAAMYLYNVNEKLSKKQAIK